MRVLEVSRYKKNFLGNQLPFVTEQGESLRKAGCDVDYFLVRGNYVKAVGALKAKIREFKPDIVHAHFGLYLADHENDRGSRYRRTMRGDSENVHGTIDQPMWWEWKEKSEK